MNWVIFFAVLLYGHVGKMDKHIVQLIRTLCVFHSAKSTEPKAVHVALEWPVRSNQNVPNVILRQ